MQGETLREREGGGRRKEGGGGKEEGQGRSKAVSEAVTALLGYVC